MNTLLNTRKNESFFFRSSAILLIITAAAKLYSATGSAGILKQSDSLVHVTLRPLIIAMAALELVVAGVLLLSRPCLTRAAVLLWLSGNFIVYRLANHALGIKYCSCLGTVGQRLPVAQAYLDMALTAVVLFWFLGSGYIVWRVWNKKQEVAVEAIIASRQQ